METPLFRTRRGEIDPGEAENGLKTLRHENEQNSRIRAKLIYFGGVAFGQGQARWPIPARLAPHHRTKRESIQKPQATAIPTVTYVSMSPAWALGTHQPLP